MKNSFTLLTLFITLCLFSLVPTQGAADSSRRPGLVKPRKDLFNHAKHLKHFEKLQVNCWDCHTFSVKPEKVGPTSGVKEKLTLPVDGICHQCHLGKVQMPVRNQCSLCHEDKSALKPADHFNSWRARHGKMAMNDRDACAACHQTNECTTCHFKQNTVMPVVHRANFRMSHSIQARQDPESCIMCHKTANFCIDCHSGKKR